MSIQCQQAVLNHSRRKLPGDRLLLLVLADYADEQGYCWPGIEALRQKTCLSKNTVFKALKRLEESGELVISHSRRHGNRYLITLGLSSDELAAVLREKFHWSEAQIEAHKTRCVTSGADTSPTVTYQSVTSEVTERDYRSPQNVTSEVTSLEHDPSRTINDPSGEPSLFVTSPPGQGTSPPDPLSIGMERGNGSVFSPPLSENDAAARRGDRPTPPRYAVDYYPGAVGRERGSGGEVASRDPLFAAIAERLFGVPEGEKVPRAIAGRVGKVKSALRDMTLPPDADEFHAACDHRQRRSPDLTLPRDPGKVITMLYEYRRFGHDLASSPFRTGVPGHPGAHPGGTGAVETRRAEDIFADD